MNQVFKENKKNLKVLTANGYQHFKGISYMGDFPIYRLEFGDNSWLECTDNHFIFTKDDVKIEAKEFKVGDTVLSLDGKLIVTSAFYTGRIEPVYDLIGVDNGNRFYGNNILVSNCEFISFDETLLNAVWIAENLNKMGKEPLRKSGQVRWYKEISPHKTYVVSLDPSLGTGNDFAAIQVFQLPELIQVAEWRHNKTRAKSQIAVMMEILKEIYSELEEYSPEIYWSVENNTIGETSLYIIDETGEEMFPGVFLSEIRRKGNSKVYRKGYNTTNKKKVESCSRMKTLLEEGKMSISSKALIGELKFFVAKGNGYEAKSGKTDDLVSAVLLSIRMMQDLMEWDADLREAVAQNIGDELGEELEPMPTIML